MISFSHKTFIAAFFAFVPFVAFAAAGDVVINEIAWMGTAASPSDEWIELRNNTPITADLSGWTLVLLKPATTTPSKIIALSGGIAANGFYLIERTDDAATDVPADLVFSFGNGLVDGGMILELAHNGIVVDRTPEPCENKWCAGTNNPEMSMERIKPDADGGVAANWATNNGVKINGKDSAGAAINGTPKRENSAYNNPPLLPSPDASSSPPSSVSPSNQIYPSLTVDAGPDRTALVGSLTSFSGLALGINNTPLPDGRFLWNLGDGTLKESRTWEHVYYFPGTYTAALTVSSGQYSGSDTAVITAVIPRLAVKNTQTGEDGFAVVANGSDTKLDLGGMILRDSAGAQFLIPKNSFVLSNGEITIPNRVSGLLKSGGAVFLYDAAGREVRAAQLATNNQQLTTNNQRSETPISAAPEAARTVASANVSSSARGETLSVESEISAVESAEQEVAAASSASHGVGFALSKNSLFFGASVFLGLLFAAGFFLFKNFF